MHVWGSPAPDGFHVAISTLGSWWPIGGWSQDKCLHGVASVKTLIFLEIEVKHGKN